MAKLKKYNVKGEVINTETQKGLGGAKVEAWDKDKVYDDLLGVAITSSQGKFQIDFNENYYREFAKENAPDIYFKVFYGNKLIKNTEDSVIVNAQSKTKVTIEAELPKRAPTGKDRINTLQMLQRVKFIQKSDFLGAITETNSRTSKVGGFAADMLKNSMLKMDWTPIQVKMKSDDVVNQDVAAATNNLQAQEITVNEVKAYQPGMNARSLEEIKGFPPSFSAGSKVDLYEENGKVKYYTIVKEPRVDTAVKNELDNIRAEKAAMNQELVQLRAEVETLNMEREKVANTDALRAELNELNNMYQDLSMSIAKERPVSSISEIDANTDKQLKNLNILTVDELSNANEAELIAAGISDVKANEIIGAAKFKLNK